MKNIFLIIIIISLTSCEGMYSSYCPQPANYKKREAQKMYNSFGTILAQDITDQKAQNMFGCQYEDGDDVYQYSTFWGKKYILARNGEAITYFDNK